MGEIYFKNEESRVKVEDGTTILQAARLAGILIESPCDAIGTCGKCKVRLEGSSLTEAKIKIEKTNHRVSPEEEREGYVLSCQTKVFGDITVLTNNIPSRNNTLKILSEGNSFEYNINPYITKKVIGRKTEVYGGSVFLGEEEEESSQAYGMVVDIGTTTLVAALVELKSGEELGAISSLNPQSLKAQDVLTRINLASNEDGLSQMYVAITSELNRMIEELSATYSVKREWIYEVVYSGNTAMIHLATNINPKPLGQYPYTPVIRGGNTIAACGHINISPFGLIYLPPIISAYVGPDITSGVIASQLQHAKGTTLFIDIGTNGEMILAKNGQLFATSTAAGPAFEGMNIEYGMRAGNGAIESFSITEDNRIETKVIGEVEGVGICGSGLLDVVGELVRVGIIGSNGKLTKPIEESQYHDLGNKLILKNQKPAFSIIGDVVLTQKDIRQVQLAKGAIRAGIEALLKQMNICAKEVDRVEIAGSFGFHLKESSLIHIGMLPAEFAGKIHFVGNTSKSGGKAFLLNKDLREVASKVVHNITVVELANSEGFDKLFIKAMSF